jgi:hypothetical protein
MRAVGWFQVMVIAVDNSPSVQSNNRFLDESPNDLSTAIQSKLRRPLLERHMWPTSRIADDPLRKSVSNSNPEITHRPIHNVTWYALVHYEGLAEPTLPGRRKLR